ncbi:hypothetical protein Tco_0207821, partial [Tanacetum coccineum]
NLKLIKQSKRANVQAGLSTRLEAQVKELELTRKSVVSDDEGVGISPKVPDKTKYDYEAQSDDDVWGSTDEEKNKDKNEDDVSEEEENVSEEAYDEEESVSEEENTNEENEKESDDNNKSFNITTTNDERTESDNHEVSKEGKTVAEIEEEETANSEHEEDDTKGDDQKSKDEPKGDDQATKAEVGVSDLVKIKEKLEFLQSTSSHLISLIFGNQFLVNSSN